MIYLKDLNDDLYHSIKFIKSDNSRGENITLSEDGIFLTFSKSGLVDFTGMIAITNEPDIYMNLTIQCIKADGSVTNRCGSRIRSISGDDQESCVFRRIMHVDSGDKHCLMFHIPSWCDVAEGNINANSPITSCGLMAQYIAYD